MQIPDKVKYIIEELATNGYEAYAVGGCVRDSLLQKTPKDWDITTSAEPQEVKKIFKKTVDTGIKHGTVTVMLYGEGFEVTTYRLDGEYEDNRKPKNVEFTSSLIEDLKRRDFTINAMAYNPNTGVVDEFNSVSDLKNKIIRCVGNPDDRFTEDALRMLRALRFSAQLGFEIEENTKLAIKKNVKLLNNISAERIQVELTKLIISNNPGRLLTAFDLGVTNIILPEFDKCISTLQTNKYHIYNVALHSIIGMENIEPTPILRWTMLLHDIAKPQTLSVDIEGINHFYGHQEKGVKIAYDILKRLKFDSNTIDKVTRLIRFHDYDIQVNEKSIRRCINRIGNDIFFEFIQVQRADALAKNLQMTKEKLQELKEIETIYKEILEKNQCVSIKQLAINGKDLLNIGIPQGKKIGEILTLLLEEVIDDPELNKKEVLLNKCKNYN